MRVETLVVVIVGLIGLCFVAIWGFRRLPRRLRRITFRRRWRSLQQLCRDRDTWGQAIIQADLLLDVALKKRRFKGSSMGERLVAAQKLFTDHDAVWSAHKLRSQLELHPNLKLTEKKVKSALLGLGQGLKDIGAL